MSLASIPRKLFSSLLSLVALGVLTMSACQSPPDRTVSDMGSVEAALVVAPGQTLASASYVITGPGGFSRAGTIDIRNSTTLSSVIGGLPAGIGYSITVTATSTEGGLSCSGTTTFDVVARMTTLVQIHIRCLETPRTGGIGVNGTINVCPLFDGLSATPAEVMVGSSIALLAQAHDLDNRPALLTYQWTATAGMLSSPSGTSSSLTCTGVGTVTVTVIATDGDCSDSAAVTLTCSPRDLPLPLIKINEVESNGGTPGDWVELYNAGTAAVDLSGWVFKDNDDTHAYSIPAGTTIAAGAYYVLEEAAFGFGLGAMESARLYEPGATTIVDSHTWTAHAAVTYHRCPNGTGAFVSSANATKGAANDCGGGAAGTGGGTAGAGGGAAGTGGTGGAVGGAGGAPAGGAGGMLSFAWPGGADVVTVDETNQFPSNLSGLTYQAASGSDPAVLWAVLNAPSTLFRLVFNGTSWVNTTTGDWGAGKTLRYTDGTGGPDSESVTRAESGTPFIYISSERNNDFSSVSRLVILRYDSSAPGANLVATHQWDITADLPAVGANLGFEAITWVPDSYLVASSFFDERTSASYNPANYPDHGTGLFFVGIEANGLIHAYALDHTGGSFARVASFASSHPGMMAIEFDRDTNYLWAGCDNTCGNKLAILQVGATTPGRFGVSRVFDRPAMLPDSNNEGIAFASEAECVGGFKSIFWSDDSNFAGHALRRGTIPCGAFVP